MSDSDRTTRSATDSPVNAAGAHSAPSLPGSDSVLKRREGESLGSLLGWDAKPKPASPQNTIPPRSRIAPFPSVVDLGERIVDSFHPANILVPQVFEHQGVKQHANAIVSIAPAHAAMSPKNSLEQGAAELRRAEAFTPVDALHPTTSPIPVRFAPKFPGTHEADVSVLLRWPDEVIEQRIVRVQASARRIDQAPASSIGGAGVRAEHDDTEIPTADLSTVAKIHETALDNAYRTAKTTAGGLAANQQPGLENAREHAEAYKERPPKQPWWAPLAELAITMAVGGIAGVVARLAAARFAPKLATMSRLETKVDAEQLKAFSETAVADSVKDGLKNAVRAPIVKQAIGDRNRDASSNGFINFFAMQTAALKKLQLENQRFIDREHRRLQHLLLIDPARAVAIMESIEEAMTAKLQDATELQQTESERQWVSVVARSSQGSDAVNVDGELRGTTGIARPDDWGRIHAPERGILVIHVAVPPNELSEVSAVKGASIKGISQPIADRLWTQDLSSAAIPIKIIAESEQGSSWIMRDEVGRVRIPYRGAEEAQLHRGAQLVVDRVLAKTLQQWNVKRVLTDDEDVHPLPAEPKREGTP